MGWRLKIGRAAGIDVFLHWTFLFAPIYVVYSCWETGWATIGVMLVLLACLFACVLLHEYGHAMAARYFGIKTQDIIITPIGGLARLFGMSRNHPWQEFVIALAGPVVNLVLCLMFLVYLLVTSQGLIPDNIDAFPQILFWANLALFLFNLVPAFPMDGGRILRSLLAVFLPYQSATMIAGNLGRVLAILFILTGLYRREFPFILIGLFVFFAATAEIEFTRVPTESERLDEYAKREI